jgi:hypothetical protein
MQNRAADGLSLHPSTPARIGPFRTSFFPCAFLFPASAQGFRAMHVMWLE